MPLNINCRRALCDTVKRLKGKNKGKLWSPPRLVINHRERLFDFALIPHILQFINNPVLYLCFDDLAHIVNHHTFAVLVKTVQGNLEHATAALMLNVYGHASERTKDDRAARMEQYINGLWPVMGRVWGEILLNVSNKRLPIFSHWTAENKVYAECIHDVSTMDTQVRLTQKRIIQDKLNCYLVLSFLYSPSCQIRHTGTK